MTSVFSDNCIHIYIDDNSILAMLYMLMVFAHKKDYNHLHV